MFTRRDYAQPTDHRAQAGDVFGWCWQRHGVERRPHFPNAHPLGREHAVLETVQVLAVKRGHQLAGQQTKEDPGREVVLADPLAKLKVLIEDGLEGERSGL